MPVGSDTVQSGVKAGSVSQMIVRSDSEGRLCPGGLLYGEPVINFSVFSDEGVNSLPVCDNSLYPKLEGDTDPLQGDYDFVTGKLGVNNLNKFGAHFSVTGLSPNSVDVTDPCFGYVDSMVPDGSQELSESVVEAVGRRACMASEARSTAVIDHSIVNELCIGAFSHYLDGCKVQLNSCNFYRELYLMGEVDVDADFLYHRICHGFDIVDPTCSTSYDCVNYDSINAPEFRSQMDTIVYQEL